MHALTINPDCMVQKSGIWANELMPTGSKRIAMAKQRDTLSEPAMEAPILGKFQTLDYLLIGALCTLLTIPIIRLTLEDKQYNSPSQEQRSIRPTLDSKYSGFYT